MKKNLMAAALAGAMALSLSVPALAANETVVTATYAEPKIEVSVPTTATAVINPYGLPCKYAYDTETGKVVKAGTDGAVEFQSSSTSAIATQPMILVNYGETALKVSATPSVTIKAGSDMAVAATIAQDDGKTPAGPVDKAVSVTVAGSPITGAAASWDTETKKLKMDAGLATAWKGVDWTSSNTEKKVTTAFAAANSTAGSAQASPAGDEELGTLAAIHADKGATGDAAKVLKVQDDCMLAVSIESEAVKKPKTAWTAKDIVTVTIAYSFEVDNS